MSTMTLRGIDEKTAAALKDKARHEGTSVNAVALRLLRQTLGLEKPRRNAIHNDLDHLAGTWSATDAADFANATAPFEAIDENLWRSSEITLQRIGQSVS